MCDIYLSSTISGGNGPLNLILCSALENQGYKVFLPQREVSQHASPEEMCTKDFEGMINSRIILAIFKNASKNFYIELGFAYGIQKPIIGILETHTSLEVMATTIDMDILRVNNTEHVEEYLSQLNDKLVSFATATQALLNQE